MNGSMLVYMYQIECALANIVGGKWWHLQEDVRFGMDLPVSIGGRARSRKTP